MINSDVKNILPLKIVGTVIHGYKRGSKELGIPTANIDLSTIPSLHLSDGIYCGYAQLVKTANTVPLYLHKSPIYMMCASYGKNPYYNNVNRSLEVHIINEFKENFYGEILRLIFCEKMRDEIAFDSLQALIDQIHLDIKKTKEILTHEKWNNLPQDNFFTI